MPARQPPKRSRYERSTEVDRTAWEVEVDERIRGLEKVVQQLRRQTSEESTAIAEDGSWEERIPGDMDLSPVQRVIPAAATAITQTDQSYRRSSIGTISKPGASATELANLVIDGGRSRYVNDGLWAHLINEVCQTSWNRFSHNLADYLCAITQLDDVRGLLDSDGDDTQCNSSIGEEPMAYSWDQPFMFTRRLPAISTIRSLHPNPTLVESYWQAYVTNVDPVAKILHKPSIKILVSKANDDLNSIDKPTEALLFAIYYAATISMTPEATVRDLGEDKKVLITRYKFAVEQALVRADLINTQDLVTLQAFVIFLICLRTHCHPRYVWTLTGLAIRIAQSMGIQRDGENFNLSVLETEARRRLWVQLYTLDVRASEDFGCNPTIPDGVFDTKKPLNINDTELSVGTISYPHESEGCTEMTFSLIRYEVTSIEFHDFQGSGSRFCNHYRSTVEMKNSLIDQCEERINARYLHTRQHDSPLLRMCTTLFKTIITKARLSLCYPTSLVDSTDLQSGELEETLLLSRVEIIENVSILLFDASTEKFRWMFRTYMQWKTLAVVLDSLCRQPWSPLLERAWKAIDGLVLSWNQAGIQTQNLVLWKPIEKLMEKAKQRRCERLIEENQLWMPNFDVLTTNQQILTEWIPEPGRVASLVFGCRPAQS